MVEIGRRIGRLRRERKWSQGALAAKAGVHKNTILHAELTGDIRLDTLSSIARALDIDAAELLSSAMRESA
jgi:transcriptional regulator with XRE-family HTH domain